MTQVDFALFEITSKLHILSDKGDISFNEDDDDDDNGMLLMLLQITPPRSVLNSNFLLNMNISELQNKAPGLEVGYYS